MINENQEICKRIAEEIESYCENKMKRCPQCEEKIEWDDAQYNPHNGEYTCPICGGKFDESELETLSVYDYLFQNCYETEYQIDARGNYRGVEIMVAGGGPNIYVNTKRRSVMLFWWREKAEWEISSDAANEIDEYFEQNYEIMLQEKRL